eukprot:GHRR01006882.1.p1 GENE.GHRR01006882.1~~GHRR01006882.1.p1  ORF type:complete len:281 (+),score=71.49 GHRR01006882.1:761-1603(+)
MIKPAIFGTENVLHSVNKTPTVRQVVFTASIVSVWGDPHERGKGHVFTENDWNITATPKSSPYFYSKSKAEERAYAMHKAAGGKWSLCSMNPGTIWGPPTSSRADGESVGQLTDLLSGALWPWAPPLGAAAVDVRDVARAHCVAAINPKASGRYLLSAESTFILATAAKILRQAYPQRWLPPLKPPKLPLLLFGPWMGLPRNITRATFRKKPMVNVDKAARDLGITQYIPLQQSILDMAQDMLAKEMVPDWKMPKVVPILCFWAVVLFIVFYGLLKLFGW